MADRFGRRKVIMASSLIFTIGSFVMGFAWNKYVLLVGRFVVGAAIGLASMAVPVYIVEIAPSSVRGSLVTCNNFFITFGQASAGLVAAGFAYIETIGWRLMLGVAAVPAILQFVGFLFMPESPRWLIRNKRDFEAMKVLQRVRGKDANIEKEFNQIKAFCQKEEERSANLRRGDIQTISGRVKSYNSTGTSSVTNSIEDNEQIQTESPEEQSPPEKQESTLSILKRVWAHKYIRKALIVGIWLQMIQQLTGINTVMYYSATIIQMSGVHDKKLAVWFASITSVVNSITAFCGLFFVEKVGRRRLTLGSLAGVILSLNLLAIGFQLGGDNSPPITFDAYGNNSKEICSSYSNCMGCITSPDCGYCFMDDSKFQGNWYPNGTCVSSYKEDPTKGSQHSSKYPRIPCEVISKGSNYTNPSDEVWAFEFCPSPFSWMILLGLCLYLVSFSPGMGPMPWTINSEMFPIWARATCFSVTTSTNWFFNMLVSLTFLTLAKAISKQGAFWLYAAFGVTGFIFFCYNLPETKGRNLEQTESLFIRRKSSNFNKNLVLREDEENRKH